jgi:hypothetical protein
MAKKDPASKRQLAVARAYARYTLNLQRAFGDLVPKLKRAYGQPVCDAAMVRDQDVVALTAIADFLDRMGGGAAKGDLAHFAHQFARLAQTRQDATIASRSDSSLVWIPRAYVSVADWLLCRREERRCGRRYSRKAAAKWIAERHPGLRCLITEKTAWDAKRSQSLVTAIISWSRDFDRNFRRADSPKIKNEIANRIYSRLRTALEEAPDCGDDDQIEALLHEALRVAS